MTHFLILGKNGHFAKNFMRRIIRDRLGTYEYISYVEFQNQKGLENLTFKDEIVYIYCFGGKNQVRQRHDESELLTVFLDSLDSKKRNRSSLIFLSSGEIYGRSYEPFSENSPIDPKTEYAITKVRSEHLLIERGPELLREIHINRVANAYSCEELGTQNNLIANLIRSIVSHEPFTLTSSKFSRKQYGTFSDYANLMLNVLLTKKDDTSIEPVSIRNVAPSFSYSINEILTILENCFSTQFGIFQTRSDANESSELDSRILTSNRPINYRWASLEEELLKIVPIRM